MAISAIVTVRSHPAPALLTARAALLLDEGATGAVTAREAFGLGRLYERAGMNPDALASFTRAYEMGSAVQVEALRARALLLRRLRRYEDAAETWQRLLDLRSCPPGVAREATEALAVHHEHRLRNLPSARCFALRSLELDAGHARRNAAEHRLARLDRKLGRSSSAPLF
jgi:tetratricopeptide (TPR) repeat protein